MGIGAMRMKMVVDLVLAVARKVSVFLFATSSIKVRASFIVIHAYEFMQGGLQEG
jgi:hypothetical protein